MLTPPHALLRIYPPQVGFSINGLQHWSYNLIVVILVKISILINFALLPSYVTLSWTCLVSDLVLLRKKKCRINMVNKKCLPEGSVSVSSHRSQFLNCSQRRQTLHLVLVCTRIFSGLIIEPFILWFRWSGC